MNGVGFILLLFLHLLLGFVVFVASVVVTDADDNDLPKLIGAALMWEIILPVLGMCCITVFIKSVLEHIAFGDKEE